MSKPRRNESSRPSSKTASKDKKASSSCTSKGRRNVANSEHHSPLSKYLVKTEAEEKEVEKKEERASTVKREGEERLPQTTEEEEEQNKIVPSNQRTTTQQHISSETPSEGTSSKLKPTSKSSPLIHRSSSAIQTNPQPSPHISPPSPTLNTQKVESSKTAFKSTVGECTTSGSTDLKPTTPKAVKRSVVKGRGKATGGGKEEDRGGGGGRDRASPWVSEERRGGGLGGERGRRGRGVGRRRQATEQTDTHTKREIQQSIREHFPVRRSGRRCKSEIENDQLAITIHRLRTRDESGLKVVEVEGKGRGVKSTRPFSKGDLICEYSGELISHEEAKRREEDYSLDPSIGCYMYYFSHKTQKLCMDATADNGRLGRLLNHSRTSPNATTKLLEVEGQPYLCLVAARDIHTGEELEYDYGETSKEALESHPWLAT